MGNPPQIVGGGSVASPKDFESGAKEMIRAEAERITNGIAGTGPAESLGFEKGEQGKAKDSGDSRNGSCERAVDAESGPIKVSMPRGRNGDFESKMPPPYARRAEGAEDQIMRPCQPGLSDQGSAGIAEALHSARHGRSTTSSIADDIDVKDESEYSAPQLGHLYLWTPSCLLPSFPRATWHLGHLGSRFAALDIAAFSILDLLFALAADSRLSSPMDSASSLSLIDSISS